MMIYLSYKLLFESKSEKVRYFVGNAALELAPIAKLSFVAVVTGIGMWMVYNAIK